MVAHDYEFENNSERHYHVSESAHMLDEVSLQGTSI